MSDYLNLKPVEFSAMGKKNQAAFQWEGRIMLPKYDGCFAMVAFCDGVFQFVMSRTGELVKSMDHIANDLLRLYPWITNEPRVMILGEAWTPGKDFATLSGEFRRQYAQPQLGFAPFDAVKFIMDRDAMPVLSSVVNYRSRLKCLERVRALGGGMVFAPALVYCVNEGHARHYAQALKNTGGYDGCIVSDPNGIYVPGAGKGGEFVKVKPLARFTLRCTGFKADVGEKTGRPTGALIVSFRGKDLGVATGLSEAQQADLGQFVGKLIDVDAMGVSSKGLLREPRFVGVRDDVLAPDA